MAGLLTPRNFRNVVFGVEDSLVSTVGLLSGVAVAGVGREVLVMTGAVLILVEAFSMAAGSFLAESSAQEYEAGSDVPMGSSYLAGAMMFVSYFFAGFVPLLPYVFVTGSAALGISVGATLAALFVVGAASAALSHTHMFKRAVRMFVVGGLAILAGMVAGSVLSLYLPVQI